MNVPALITIFFTIFQYLCDEIFKKSTKQITFIINQDNSLRAALIEMSMFDVSLNYFFTFIAVRQQWTYFWKVIPLDLLTVFVSESHFFAVHLPILETVCLSDVCWAKLNTGLTFTAYKVMNWCAVSTLWGMAVNLNIL